MRKLHRRSVEENKKLIEKYPFLKHVDWHTGEDLKEYHYTYTYADEMEGWWDAFGEMMCDEIREELLRYDFLDQFRVHQVKEKYGGLRFYHGGCPKGSDIDIIIEKYSLLSENICVNCGRPDVPMINDGVWISPYCRDCCDDKTLWDETAMCKRLEPTKLRMSDELRYSTFDGKRENIVIDISAEAEKIRRRYEERMGREKSRRLAERKYVL